MKKNTDSFHYKGNTIIETAPEKDETLKEVKTDTLTVSNNTIREKHEHEWIKLLKLDQAECMMLSLKVEETPVMPLPEPVNMCETVTLCGEA